MVWGAKGALADEGFVSGEHIGYGVDTGDVECFRKLKPGQDAGHGPRNQRFTTAGRAGHEHVVRSGGGHLSRSFRMFLPLDMNVIFWQSRQMSFGLI